MSTESRRIQTILGLVAKWPAVAGAGVEATIGLNELDDCAVVPVSPEWDLVVGTDFVRGTGFYLFKQGILGFEDIGFYLIGANASDLAAMGASPLGVVVVARYTSGMSDADFEQVMSGVVRASAELGLPLLGGDTGGYEESVLSATVLGLCPSGRALRRSGGLPGDRLFSTGTVGRAGAAIAYYVRGKSQGIALGEEVERGLAESWKRVKPALQQGCLLVQQGLSRCAIDTSDGLKASVRQIAEASGVDAILFEGSVPIDPLARSVAEAMGVDALALSISDSVDFRLVFSVRPSLAGEVERSFAEQGWELFEIGKLGERSENPRALLDRGGELVDLPGIEWDQAEVPAIDRLCSA